MITITWLNTQLYAMNCREGMLVCGKDGFTVRAAMQRMMTLAILTSTATYSYYYALTLTSSTDVTAVFSSATGFVYILSILWLKEPFVFLRVMYQFFYVPVVYR